MTDVAALPLPVHRRNGVVAASPNDAVAVWLWCLAATVFLMVFLGGATRLTESGLSITEWKPITGVLPPLTHAAWSDAFDKYKAIPQYASMFPDMTLGHFRAIFLMEWLHRLVGRILGLALLLPLVFFWTRSMLTPRLKGQMIGVFALGGLQGVVGWWMVASGLKDRVEVAQERLAAHLLLASLTFAALVWIASEQRRSAVKERVPAMLSALSSMIVALTFAQIGLGALVAGLRAGSAYNTWPLMDGQLIPPASLLGALQPGWRNFVDNIATVQFDHRVTAYLLLAAALAQTVATLRMRPAGDNARRTVAFAALVTCQATIGVVTLLYAVPIAAGLLHQIFAMVVLAAAVVHRQRLGRAGGSVAADGPVVA